MSMLSVHAAAIATSGSIYHEFLLRYRKSEQVVYGIVEGKDDPIFYRGLLEQFLPSDWNVHLIRSGNRANVLKTFADFDWTRFSAKRICFFVDRDLSMFQAVPDPVFPNLYVTNQYSIENEAASYGTVARLLNDILNVCELDVQESDFLSGKFSSNLANFCEWLAPVMAQIVIWQRSGDRPSLDNILPKEIFTFVKGDIALRSGFEMESDRIAYVAGKMGLPTSSTEELAAVLDEFRRLGGCKRFIRGKYVLWFVIESTLEFHREIALFCRSYQAPPKVKLTMGHANAMALVGTRIRCPDTLADFVRSTYLEYINPAPISLMPPEAPHSRYILERVEKETHRVFGVFKPTK